LTEQIQSNFSASRIVDLQAEYRQDFLDLDGDVKGRVQTQGYLNDSTAVYHGNVVGMGYLPKIYDNAAMQYFDQIVDTSYSILEKVTNQFVKDADYRRLFGFSPLLEHLISLPTGYQSCIPITRIDIFLDEHSGDFKFCEFNTDGSSAMNEDREICNSLTQSNVFQKFAEEHQLYAQELFDNWVQCFIEIYESSSMAKPNPRIAILDYKQSSTPHEQQEFCKRFEQAGYECYVTDIPDLEYRDGQLYDTANDAIIDAIYRRAVTFEIVDELEDSPTEDLQNLLNGKIAGKTAKTNKAGKSGKSTETNKTLHGALALVQAVSDAAVCMIGGFKTQVAHSKAIYCVLHMPQTLEFLSATEIDFVKQHVPYTTWLQNEDIDLAQVKTNKDQWIIKPVDGYGTVGVFAGKALSQAEWDELIDKHGQGGYIVQEYCEQFRSVNTLPIPVDSNYKPLFSSFEAANDAISDKQFNTTDLQPYNILTGLFCYNGKFRGTYIRSGQHALIVGFHGGVTLGSLLCDYNTDSKLAVIPRELV
jgi:hypothetical protein